MPVMTLGRYMSHLDTVQVGPDKVIFLTNGIKSSKEMLFFLNTAKNDNKKPSRAAKPPPIKSIINDSTVKNKTVTGKVLCNKMHSATQEEVLQMMASRIKEHQADLHAGLQVTSLSKHTNIMNI